jgi:MarR family transcriptional regulator, transcriptional regulator for hemolysin
VPDQPDLLFLLHDLARQIRLDADRRAAHHGMTRAQWVILIRLERQPGLSQKELAEILEVEPITVARLIDRLEDRGMVERRDDPNDRRIWRLHLCPPAKPVLADLNHERADMLRMVSAGIEAEALEAIKSGLLRMKANVVDDIRNKALEKALEKVTT